MLRVSKLIDYGTLLLAHMARQPERMFSAAELAGVLNLGQPMVSKILKMLGQHAILTSSRGAYGGYVLARSAHDISLAQVIDALEGQPFGLTECTAIGTCQIEATCHMRAHWQYINQLVRRTLEDVSIADMRRPNATASSADATAFTSACPLHGVESLSSRELDS